MDGYDGYNKVTCGTVTCTNLQNKMKRNGQNANYKTPTPETSATPPPPPPPQKKKKPANFYTWGFFHGISPETPENGSEIHFFVCWF